jgi:hypothetical protein
MTTDTDAPSVTPLAQADQAAQAMSDSQTVGATTAPCPLSAIDRKVIEVLVIGEDGGALDAIDLLLTRGDGQGLTGKTGPSGTYKFIGLEPGSYQLHLPAMDEDAWLVKSTKALLPAQAHCTNVASWESAPAPDPAREHTHIIQQGECVGKIAERYGFFPGTVWDYPANAALKKQRHGDMHVLYQDDGVVIPAKRQKTQAVSAGDKITLERQGVPEHLRVRFLHYDESPRDGVPYLLSLTTENNIPVADRSGQTDDEGYVDQAIPPSAVRATITLNPGRKPEIHRFNLGHTNPIDEISGWKARLNNLGYDCGAENNEWGPKTEAAIRAFQHAKDLEETGNRDVATKLALLAVAKS